MARPCSVCVHPSRLAIEQAVLNQKPLATIAKDFGITYTRRKDDAQVGDHKVIQRHRDQCMADAYQKAVADRQGESGTEIAARLRYLDEKVTETIEAAMVGEPVMVGDVPLLDDEGRPMMRRDWRLLLAAVREGRGNAELLAKLAGRTDDDPADADLTRADLENPDIRRHLAEVERLRMEHDRAKDGHAGGRS